MDRRANSETKGSKMEVYICVQVYTFIPTYMYIFVGLTATGSILKKTKMN